MLNAFSPCLPRETLDSTSFTPRPPRYSPRPIVPIHGDVSLNPLSGVSYPGVVGSSSPLSLQAGDLHAGLTGEPSIPRILGVEVGEEMKPACCCVERVKCWGSREEQNCVRGKKGKEGDAPAEAHRRDPSRPSRCGSMRSETAAARGWCEGEL
jgi:hypothetical protein